MPPPHGMTPAAPHAPAPHAPESRPPRMADPVRTSSRFGELPGALYSTVLDAPTDPDLELSVLWSEKAQTRPNRGDAQVLELRVFNRLAVFPNILRADVEMALNWHSAIWWERPRIDMPAGLHRVSLETGWLWRYLNGDALELRFFPGLYGATDASLRELFGMPAHVVWHRVLSPDLAGFFGLAIRPGWEIPLTPLAGVAWEPHQRVRLEAMVPRSRGFLYLGRVTLLGTAEWRNHSYAVAPDRAHAGRITSDDILLSLGLTFRVSDELTVGLNAGGLYRRTLNGNARAVAKTDVDDASFVRIALHGPF